MCRSHTRQVSINKIEAAAVRWQYTKMDNYDFPPLITIYEPGAIRAKILHMLERRSVNAYGLGFVTGFILGALITTLIFRKR